MKTDFIKWGAIITIIGILGIGGFFLAKELSKPLPGTAVADQGRGHITKEEWEKFKYNSNPPTSGPHDSTWTKAGIYEKPQEDGYVVHSLEHGYVVISYNCKKISKGSKETKGTEETKKCGELKKQLGEMVNEQKEWKLIVVPRPNLDTAIALTAWGRIDKMNTLDAAEVVRFINAFRDRGPEKTME